MIKEILGYMVKPLWILFCIMVWFAVADMVLDYVERKKYTAALITIVIVAAVAWPSAICVAIYVGYKMKKEKVNTKKKEEKHIPSPGSSADYERWKASRDVDEKGTE